jgi:hypothetical protein
VTLSYFWIYLCDDHQWVLILDVYPMIDYLVLNAPNKEFKRKSWTGCTRREEPPYCILVSNCSKVTESMNFWNPLDCVKSPDVSSGHVRCAVLAVWKSLIKFKLFVSNPVCIPQFQLALCSNTQKSTNFLVDPSVSVKKFPIDPYDQVCCLVSAFRKIFD